MDLLVEYGSDLDSDGADRTTAPAVAGRRSSAGYNADAPSVKRARLEAAT